MKKNNVLIYIAIISIAIASFIFILNYNNNDNIKSKYLDKINYTEFKQLIDNKETFILYIGSKDCSHCKAFAPKFIDVIEKYKINVNYIDLATYSEANRNKVFNIINISGTPTVVFITKGEEQYTANRIDGDRSKDIIIEKLRLNNYIK
jgi:predicted bacteriocin transport accessory protein